MAGATGCWLADRDRPQPGADRQRRAQAVAVDGKALRGRPPSRRRRSPGALRGPHHRRWSPLYWLALAWPVLDRTGNGPSAMARLCNLVIGVLCRAGQPRRHLTPPRPRPRPPWDHSRMQRTSRENTGALPGAAPSHQGIWSPARLFQPVESRELDPSLPQSGRWAWHQLEPVRSPASPWRPG